MGKIDGEYNGCFDVLKVVARYYHNGMMVVGNINLLLNYHRVIGGVNMEMKRDCQRFLEIGQFHTKVECY